MKKNLICASLLFLGLVVNGKNKLSQGEDLAPGQSLFSNNNKYQLIYQTDGNLVLYRTRDNYALWHTHTDRQPAGRCSMQYDGNFVVYKPDGTPIWASIKNWNVAKPCRGQYLIMQDDGNAVVYDDANKPMWESGTYRERINNNLDGIPCLPPQSVKGSRIEVNFRSGDDDLRGYNSAFLTVNFNDGSSASEIHLLNGLGANKSSIKVYDLGREIDLNNVRSIRIRHDGTPNNNPFNGGDIGHTYDNWDLKFIGISLVIPNGTRFNIYDSGLDTKGGDKAPIRFTGERRTGEFLRQL